MANVKIRPRRDTTANWNSYNPVLADGEMGFEIIGTGQPLKLKIGDGNTAWTGLTYAVDFPSIQSAASTASNAASAASTSSANAKTSETNAKASETNAASSASAASTSASNASSSASAASTSASNAASSANASASSASAAASSASAADAAKTAAASSASAAATSEANATSSAQAAANSAASLTVVNDLTTGGTTNALSAEQGKVLSTSISTLTADTNFPVKNEVSNGDFSNGVAGWYVNGSINTIAASDGVLTSIIAQVNGASYVRPSLNATPTPNSKYYIKYDFKPFRTHNPAVYVFGVLATATAIATAGQFNTISLVVSVTTPADNLFVLYDNNRSTEGMVVGSQTQYKNVLAINLTSRFGAGNEPTVAQMDAILAFYPNSWFNGTVNLASNPKLLPYLLNATRNRPIMASGTYAARPTSVTFPTLYLSTDKAAGNVDRLTLNVGGTTWLQI